MIEYTEYNGKRYHRYPESKRKSDARYYRRGKNYLHRVVWETHNGPIPKGHQIHHINGDFGDNRIENLECLTPVAHVACHPADMTEQRQAHLASIRPQAAAWHASDEGREWHRQHGRDVWADKKPKAYQCQHCGCEYETRTVSRHRFCSNNCKSAWRRAAGLDNITVTCATCAKEYVKSKYSKSRTCGPKCAWALRRQPQTSVGPS